MGHFNFIPLSDIGIYKFLSRCKTVSRSPLKEDAFPPIQRPTKEDEATLVFRAPSSPPEDSFSFFPIPGTEPKRLRVPSQHFLKSISPFSQAELANCGLCVPMGAPGQGKGSPHQGSLRVPWFAIQGAQILAWTLMDKAEHLPAWDGGLRGKERGAKATPPTQPAPASTLGSGRQLEEATAWHFGMFSPWKGGRTCHCHPISN